MLQSTVFLHNGASVYEDLIPMRCAYMLIGLDHAEFENLAKLSPHSHSFATHEKVASYLSSPHPPPSSEMALWLNGQLVHPIPSHPAKVVCGFEYVGPLRAVSPSIVIPTGR